MQTLFQCPINGNTHGMPHGISLFIALHLLWSTLTLQRSNLCYLQRIGTCIPTVTFLPMNGCLAELIPRFTHVPHGGYTELIKRTMMEKVIQHFWNQCFTGC